MFEDLGARTAGLPQRSLSGLDSDELLTAIGDAQQLINRLTAAQLRLVAEFAHRRPAPGTPVPPAVSSPDSAAGSASLPRPRSVPCCG